MQTGRTDGEATIPVVYKWLQRPLLATLLCWSFAAASTTRFVCEPGYRPRRARLEWNTHYARWPSLGSSRQITPMLMKL